MECTGSLAAPTEQAVPTLAEFPKSVGFVGRRQELQELRSALDSAFSGKGRLVMLVGEPGIGKTRTAQELAVYAETQGAKVLWGRCYEGEGAPPYWPWVQPLRYYIQQANPEQLRADLGPGASYIGEILLELREKLPDLESPPTLEAEQARFRLFDSIATFLKNVARRQPVVLVLDDLHWADRSSLLLLEFIAPELQSIPLLLMGAYRDVELSRQHPLSRTLGNLIRTAGFVRLHLQGLTQSEVAQFLDITPGWDSSPQTIAAIHQRTDGNPLFVNEILRGFNQEMLYGRVEYLGSIPAGVKDAIGRRLCALSERCNRMLTTASVIGRGFELRLLGKVVDEASEDQLLMALEEALTARIIEEVSGSTIAYQFSHALIQDTLVAELSAVRKAQLHARIGKALEEIYEGGADDHAAELAFHFAQAKPVIGTDELVRYSLLAGERALAAYAWEEALQHFRRGLEAKRIPLEGQEPSRDADEAALLFGLGRAQAATLHRGRLEEALTNLDRSFDYYADAGDVHNAVAVAEYPLEISYAWSSEAGRRIDRALTLVPPDSITAGRLLATVGLEAGRYENDYDKARGAFGRALAIARRERDVDLEMCTLAAWANVDYFHLHLSENLERSLRVIELARRVGDNHLEVNGHYLALRTLNHLGESKDAEEHFKVALALAERLRTLHWLSNVLRCGVNLYHFWGNWDQARELALHNLSVEPNDAPMLKELVSLEFELGEFEQGEVHLKRMQEIMKRTPASPAPEYFDASLMLHFADRITSSAEHSDIARQAAQVVLSSVLANPFPVEIVRTGLALRAVQTGDSASAQEQYVALKGLPGKMRGSFIAADRLLGLLAQTMGNLEQAMAHFGDALAFCSKEGFRPELAWTCHDYAEGLLQRDGPGDQARAMSLLEEALTVSSELGMRPLMERSLNQLERVDAPPEIRPAYPDGLSHREIEVLRLIALGKTNPEIAQELFISPNTVAHHVTNILNKANCANRTEAATYAAQHGLISR